MSTKFSSLNEFLESLLYGREIQLKYDGKEYCIFNIGADNSVEKSKILVGEGNAEESFVEYSNIYNFIEIYQMNGRKIKVILSDCIVSWRIILSWKYGSYDGTAEYRRFKIGGVLMFFSTI